MLELAEVTTKPLGVATSERERACRGSEGCQCHRGRRGGQEDESGLTGGVVVDIQMPWGSPRGGNGKFLPIDVALILSFRPTET
jgi:hypothetical protein